MSNFSEMFRKDMAYDNIMIPKKKKKKRFHSVSGKHAFGKTTGGIQIDCPLHPF